MRKKYYNAKALLVQRYSFINTIVVDKLHFKTQIWKKDIGFTNNLHHPD